MAKQGICFLSSAARPLQAVTEILVPKMHALSAPHIASRSCVRGCLAWFGELKSSGLRMHKCYTPCQHVDSLLIRMGLSDGD